MHIIIECTEPIHRTAGGLLPGAIGGPFPDEVVESHGEFTLQLKEPTMLSFGNQVVTMVWKLPGHTIGVSVHVSRFRELSLNP